MQISDTLRIPPETVSDVLPCYKYAEIAFEFCATMLLRSDCFSFPLVRTEIAVRTLLFQFTTLYIRLPFTTDKNPKTSQTLQQFIYKCTK